MTVLIEKNVDLCPTMPTFRGDPLVAVMLCTYNGSRFLAEQLDSIEAQTHQNWVLYVSDDNSTDQTLEILRRYQVKWPNGKLVIRSGPQKGFCKNFLSLACDSGIKADYYAFSDQDDIWLPEKLTAGLALLTSNKSNAAQLYCGKTLYINEMGDKIGISKNFAHLKTFRNALVQCISGGNTMIFNLRAKELLELTPGADVPSHDWWLYQLVTGSGGLVYFDTNPYVMYRQHTKSLVGGNTSLSSKLDRLMMIINGQFRSMISRNVHSIEMAPDFLTEDNLRIFNLFKKMRNQKLMDRIRLLKACRIYRETWQGTLIMQLSAILKKI